MNSVITVQSFAKPSPVLLLNSTHEEVLQLLLPTAPHDD